ncbi:MAG: DUF1080 domain-containing protein [Planctomycetaceae bacterium]|nr:DUF1080 domain-containing protein [Planctomycetaceae bacterium]
MKCYNLFCADVFCLFVCLAICFGFTAVCVAQDTDFKPLFNGKDLTGWEGNPKLWRAEDGMIVGQTGSEGDTKLTYNTFLIYKGELPKNFVVTFEYWLSKDGNSGLQYRSFENNDAAKKFSLSGYQADFDGGNAHSGILYGEGFGGILANRGQVVSVGAGRKPKVLVQFANSNTLKEKIKVEDWNSYEVTVDDFTSTHRINGEMMSVCIDNDVKTRRDSGLLGLQAHVGPPMTVKIRNLKIKALP